ncbi:penicillin-binding transpeptidase domain-containing protein [Salininema proteolyticum]|uniref:Penicillin-binding transpeptidase domain-containing protein n=1 Tax=Salininema proteolyticum TaxID=1607685 RepID=A0ABV8TVJ6_9ACTN
MNPAIRRTGVIALILLGAVFLQFNKVQFLDAADLAEDGHNARQEIEEYSVPRGEILAADGTQLAVSQPSPEDSRLKYYRTYPEGAPFSYLTGFKSLNVGSYGLERAEGPVLDGSDALFFTDKVKDLFTGETPLGGNVHTSLDPDLQRQAYDRLSGTGVPGAAVVMDPRTGEVLADVGTPGYDPDDLASNDGETAENAWREIAGPDGTDPENNLQDPSRLQTYPPGSTFKAVTAAAFIKNGYGNANTMVPAGNSYDPPDTDHTITNQGDQCPESELPLKEAFARSCNTTFAQLCVNDLSAGEMRDMASDFGIGEEFEMPLTVAKSEIGDIDSPAFRAQSCFGQQSVRLTPFQNAMIASAIANDGILMEPSLVTKITDQKNGETLRNIRPDQYNRVLSQADNEQMRILMDEVVNGDRGTGGAARQGGYDIAGKTGTAENTDEKGDDLPTHGWFIGYGGEEGSDTPTVAVSVFVKNYGDAGSGLATQIAGELMAQALEDQGN